jgi:hypothetical protein
MPSNPAPPPTDFAAAQAMVTALETALGGRCGEVKCIETHISWVLVAGEFAYKIKKPVKFGFLDFSTPAARHRFCDEEVRLNGRLASALYVGVVPVRSGAQGPHFGDDGPVIDWAVQMHRLPAQALASERLALGTLREQHLRSFAARLEAFHRSVPAAPAGSAYGSPEQVLGDALHAIDALAPLADAAACAELRAWFERQAAALAPRWQQRRDALRVREGHGDLHLDNVLIIGSEVTAFDCIEFDPALRWIDVMNDVAYLVMDLMAGGRRDLAFGFLDAYLAAGGDYDGLDVLRYYLAYRAVVRALVNALRERAGLTGGSRSQAYLRLALQIATTAGPRLLITHGLPGSGKTYVTQQLIGAAGAVRFRSDVERKRLAGLAALADSRAAGDLYTADITQATYERLNRFARSSLQGGWPTVIDAAFLRRSQRDASRQLAHELDAPFAILHCHAGMPVLRERVAQRQARGGDASEADVAVLEMLAQRGEPLGGDERAQTIEVDTTAALDIDRIVERWCLPR